MSEHDTDALELEWPEDDGGLAELPPNVPPGMLGESPVDLRKIDTFEPDGLNAGLVQESTPQTRWLTIAILYFLVITIPVAVFLLWRAKDISVRAKIVTTVVMAAGVIAVVASQVR